MPRTLPWLVEKSNKQSSRQTAIPRLRKRAEPPLSDTDNDTVGPASETIATRPARANYDDDEPPSSPPAILQAIEVEAMKEGFDADDRFRMVEDEFYLTAKLFTRHLHADEYERHKKRVQARGAAIIHGLPRATDGRTAQSDEVKLKKQAQSRSGVVRAAVSDLMSDNSATDSDSDDAMKTGKDLLADPFAGFAPLEDYSGVDLSAAVKSKVNTRAAAGFMRSPEKLVKHKDVTAYNVYDEEDGSEDLDTVVAESSGKIQTIQQHRPQRSLHTATRLPTRQEASSSVTSTTSPVNSMPDLLGRDSGRSAASAFLARRKAALEGKQKDQHLY